METHSELLLLRARRWVAEGRLVPEQVAVHWIDESSKGGTTARQIKITDEGDVEDWPEGVFYEDYEEILAIRRASRTRSKP
ncbi:MAG: DUF3696 domain-containing protein [Proteobacteria bacterium]|nr:DUF3696 domain-containing protein [Pseudomonadota bacterium]